MVSGTSAAVIGLLVAVVFYRAMRRRVERSGSEGYDEGDSPPETVNPDKHKMIASVVVDMRMNDPSLQHRVDALGVRDSETELSMTDTEGTGEVVPVSDFGLDIPLFREGVIANLFGDLGNEVQTSRLDGGQEDNQYIDPLAPPASTSPVVRRRHVHHD